MNPKVSILIPVYKAEDYIGECLHSVFEQTYENIEYILVNDSTPDASMSKVDETLEKFPNRKAHVVVINNTENKGIAATRNVLLQNATGDYIYFVDSDDFIEPDTIETLVRSAIETKSDIVRCDYFKYCDGISTPVVRKPMSKDEDLLSACLSNKYGMESLTFLFIRRDIITLHSLHFPEDINGCEDMLMTVKLFYYTNKVVDIYKPLYHYRIDNVLSITHQPLSFRSHSIKAVQEIKAFLKQEGIENRYHSELLQLMFTSKQHFLINQSIRDVDTYLSTFPEANHCYHHYNYSMRQKLLFYLAEKNCRTLLKLITRIL